MKEIDELRRVADMLSEALHRVEGLLIAQRGPCPVPGPVVAAIEEASKTGLGSAFDMAAVRTRMRALEPKTVRDLSGLKGTAFDDALANIPDGHVVLLTPEQAKAAGRAALRPSEPLKATAVEYVRQKADDGWKRISLDGKAYEEFCPPCSIRHLQESKWHGAEIREIGFQHTNNRPDAVPFGSWPRCRWCGLVGKNP